MSQRRDRLRLECESREPIRIVLERVGHNLPRDVPIQLGVAGAIDLSHASRADEREDFVGAEARPGREGHLWVVSTWPKLYGGYGPCGRDSSPTGLGCWEGPSSLQPVPVARSTATEGPTEESTMLMPPKGSPALRTVLEDRT